MTSVTRCRSCTTSPAIGRRRAQEGRDGGDGGHFKVLCDGDQEGERTVSLVFFFFLNLIQCVHALGPPSHISKTPYIGRTTLSSHGERHGALSHARRAPSWLGKCLIRIFNIVLPS